VNGTLVVVAPLVAAAVVVGAIVWAVIAIRRDLAKLRSDVERGRAVQILTAFAAAMADAEHNAKALITWQPIAAGARRAWPAEFAALDALVGGSFPFSTDQIRDAHARWTAEWLAWERMHDAEYKMRIAAAERDVATSGGAPYERARLDAVEREKLDHYQRRYEDYIRVAKKLQALAP
jgi:hypothetical protein